MKIANTFGTTVLILGLAATVNAAETLYGMRIIVDSSKRIEYNRSPKHRMQDHHRRHV